MSLYEDFIAAYGPNSLGPDDAPLPEEGKWWATEQPVAGETGPERFVEDVLGVVPQYNEDGIRIEGTGLDPWQRRLLRDFGKGERRISVRSCHGPGKTATVSWCVLYMLIFRFPQKTVATAPTRGQLFDALFAEVMTWFRHLPQELQDMYTHKSDRIELSTHPDESFFSARTARRESPEALQGVHSPNVLLLGDEASGVEEAIFEAAVGSMSGDNATTILTSNPTKTSGYFFKTQTTMADMWKTYHISADDSARVTDDFKLQVARTYGEDSSAYRVRVLGEFPKADDDTIIPFELVTSAQQRDIVELADASRVWGLDVARFGDDSSVLCERTPRTVQFMEEYRNLDLMALTGRVKARWDGCTLSQRPDLILVDSIGLGAGVVDRLRELELPARAINVSESASMADAYINLRAELWFKAREWLEDRSCHLPPEYEQLCAELVIPHYEFTSSGKIKAESKADMKKRGHKSPNFADAFILTFASNALVARQGRRGSKRWDEPLERNLPGIV
jgi:hypothetical protein